MASSVKVLALILFFSLSAIHATGGGPPPRPAPSGACKPFYPIFAFGDSTTDTGNQVRSTRAFSPASHPPYGETFFKRPTGRYCDGRLMVDHLMTALKAGFLPPHLARLPHFANQNFAVAGATSLDLMTLHRLANVTSTTAESIERQLVGFQYDTQKMDLSNALVYYGEIGGNDYNYALGARRPLKVVESLIPPVMERISNSLDTLLKRDIKHIVVQGQFPMGCISLYLKVLNGTKTDKNGCIKSVMQISDQHNRLLKDVIANLSKKHPHANIIFFDTTAAYLHILENAAMFGFTHVTDPCYVGGLEFFLAPPSPMGRPRSISRVACPNPQSYISWDGIHLTDAMYGAMMKLYLTDSKFSSPFPNFLSNCTKEH